MRPLRERIKERICRWILRSDTIDTILLDMGCFGRRLDDIEHNLETGLLDYRRAERAILGLPDEATAVDHLRAIQQAREIERVARRCVECSMDAMEGEWTVHWRALVYLIKGDSDHAP